jgi:menaquinone-dependent protoporphyrinogen oxidase
MEHTFYINWYFKSKKLEQIALVFFLLKTAFGNLTKARSYCYTIKSKKRGYFMKKVLIAYVSKTNTTREYAEYIKEQLQSEAVQVDVVEVSQVTNLHSYDVAVIGSPINGMMWLPEAVQFVEANKEDLTKLPTFYFFVSYIYESGRKMWKKAIDSSMNTVSKIVSPVAVGKFSGRVEKKFNRFISFLFGLKKDTPLNLVSLQKADELIEKIKQQL